MIYTGAVALKRNPVEFRSGPALYPDPGSCGISAFAGNMPLFISEWEGWQSQESQKTACKHSKQ